MEATFSLAYDEKLPPVIVTAIGEDNDGKDGLSKLQSTLKISTAKDLISSGFPYEPDLIELNISPSD
jgi:hypothetical protein